MKENKGTENTLNDKKNEKGFGVETFIFLAILIGAMVYMSSIMGVGSLFSTILNTAYDVLMSTVLYITAICVIMGALSALLTEFGVINLAQYVLNPIMKPVYNMPGASSVGIITCFLSDNPAILALAKEPGVLRYFKKYQTPALTNMGTAFGMGMIVITFMIGLGTEFVPAALMGLGGAVAGSIISTRIMHILVKRYYTKQGTWEEMQEYEDVSHLEGEGEGEGQEGQEEKKGLFSRVMDSMLEGGKLGWEIGFAITPGVVSICTVVMMLTFGPGEIDGVAAYTGAAYEGIELLPKLGDLLAPVTDILYGFKHGSNITVPITALGAVGAAIGLVPPMVEAGHAGPNEIAVFTAMGMTWSGYLSTHISMMDSLGRRELISSALISHTFGGLFAGVVAHYLFVFLG